LSGSLLERKGFHRENAAGKTGLHYREFALISSQWYF